jgi:hypothetical protein
VALSVTREGNPTPILGTIEVSAPTVTDFEQRWVTFSTPALISSRFPTLDTAEAAQFEARIKAVLAGMSAKRIPLDTVLLSLKSEEEKPGSVATNNDPPLIFRSARPASLVVFDGQPVLAPIGETGLSLAVNTNWDVIFDPTENGTWYLLNNGAWFIAPAFTGPYAPAPRLPVVFSKLPSDGNFAEIRKNIPGRTLKPDDAPRIFVSTKPAEIIVTTGPPVLKPIPDTSLQVVTNTNADLFLDTDNGRFYYLVSGRWFSSRGLDGPWTFATPDLPADFARIPPENLAAHVLASVPGTAPAQEAVIAAQIPRQAILKRDATKLEVSYVGPPEFKPIPGTTMSYAVNTPHQVIEVDGKYYACYQGAWFVAPAPTGPWVLAETVPAVIYTIPPSSPLYNVTYVKVYSATPTTVTYGYTAGYMMGFITAGVLVYGTGYYYPPVVVPGPVPAYLPYPYSYAGSTYYNPATGAWARGGVAYGPYGGAVAGGSAYNPATGAYARGAEVYGPSGGAGAWSAYNPATGTYAHGSAAWGPNGGTANASFTNPRYGVSGTTTQNANAYGHWGSSVVTTPTQTVHTASEGNSQGTAAGFRSSTGAEGVGVHGAGGNNAGVARGAGGNVYAGSDGNVYRHTSDGWSTWNNGSWTPVQPPARSGDTAQAGTSNRLNQGAQPGAAERTFPGQTATQGGAGNMRAQTGSSSYGQLEQDRQARETGALRQRQFGGAQEPGEFAGRRGGRRFFRP